MDLDSGSSITLLFVSMYFVTSVQFTVHVYSMIVFISAILRISFMHTYMLDTHKLHNVQIHGSIKSLITITFRISFKMNLYVSTFLILLSSITRCAAFPVSNSRPGRYNQESYGTSALQWVARYRVIDSLRHQNFSICSNSKGVFWSQLNLTLQVQRCCH